MATSDATEAGIETVMVSPMRWAALERLPLRVTAEVASSGAVRSTLIEADWRPIRLPAMS